MDEREYHYRIDARQRRAIVEAIIRAGFYVSTGGDQFFAFENGHVVAFQPECWITTNANPVQFAQALNRGPRDFDFYCQNHASEDFDFYCQHF